ncbi:MAG: class C sortase [Bacilli bacterium]|nr:class C sortase [Bacilli bacterium]
MRKNVKLIIELSLFLLGLAILIYPMITNYIYDKKVEKLEKKYNETIEIKEQKKKFNDLYKLLEEKNRILYETHQDSFVKQIISYEKEELDLTKYGLNDNIIGFLQIPSIDVNLPIYLGASNENMRLGAAHLTGTSYPIGGTNTNTVFAAHRGFYAAKMFRHIDSINIGDSLFIKNFRETLEYKAVKTEVVTPDKLEKLTIQDNKDMVTIMSCHPFPYDYQRYIVYFDRIKTN